MIHNPELFAVSRIAENVIQNSHFNNLCLHAPRVGSFVHYVLKKEKNNSFEQLLFPFKEKKIIFFTGFN